MSNGREVHRTKEFGPLYLGEGLWTSKAFSLSICHLPDSS